MSFSDQEIEEFKAEALELLEVAEKSLLALDQGAEFRSSFDAVFRGFHNLKGASGMMELEKLQAHTHELENILMQFKDSNSIPKDYISLFLRGIDTAKNLLDGHDVVFDFNVCIVQSDSTVSGLPQSAIDEFIAECLEIVDRVTKNLQLLESKQFTRDAIDSLYRDVHSLKGSAYLFSYTKLGDLAHAMESSLENIRNGTHAPSQMLIDCLFKSLEVIETIIEKIKANSSDNELAEIIFVLTNALGETAKNLDNVSAEGSVDNLIQNIDSPDTRMVNNSKDNEGASSIRVPVSLLDNLMTLMGEMVLVRNQVLQYSDRSEDLEFLSMSKRLNAVTTEIQGEMMKTRMQPIGNILSKFTRIVRDLSHDLSKNINLNLVGADTELDKSLLEAIKDPLTHIVRNSCDHGIETAEERVQAGKPKTGNINIRSFHEGGQVIIEVSDDGKGLQKDAIIKKALEKGLVSADKVGKLSEKDIYNLIFAPGFSTAEKVTNISGRGVGMDVVRTNVERIGGTVDLHSIVGAGTTIKMKIPLTLAIIPALIVKCSGNTFAVPQVKLEELVLVDQANANHRIEILHGAPVFRLRGNILPLVSLNSILKVSDKNEINYESGVINIAILSAEQSSFGLIIDEIQDTADIVVKPLNNLLKSLNVFSGATILGNGSVALILDVLGISKVAQIGLSKTPTAKTAEENKGTVNSVTESQEYLLVKLNSPTKHALVLGYVHRLEEFKRADIEYSGKQPVIRYRDNTLPLINANEQLQYDRPENQDSVMPVVVVQKAGMLFGIQVDDIIDTLSTPVEMDTALVKQKGIFGSLNTKNELIVVIDPFEMISDVFPEAAVISELNPETGLHKSKESHKAHILLVEDTVFFRKAVKMILEKAGYKISSVADGLEGLSFLNQDNQKIDLIISDIEMPKMNGLEFAKNVRKHPSFVSMPLIALSSLADQKHIKEGFKAGFDLYLEKLNSAALLSAVSQLLDKNEKRIGA